ncbi:MAG TPA: hypothetical protein VNO30_41520 [Kofleriaceae bacterium]|nr:hypothetical protein [Kofleriaceae bacterium]
MTDVVVHRCVLRVRRTSGWTWGRSPDALLAAATHALPRLIAGRLEAFAASTARPLHVTAPMRIRVEATVGELGELAAMLEAAGELDLARVPLGRRIGAALDAALAWPPGTLAEDAARSDGARPGARAARPVPATESGAIPAPDDRAAVSARSATASGGSDRAGVRLDEGAAAVAPDAGRSRSDRYAGSALDASDIGVGDAAGPAGARYASHARHRRGTVDQVPPDLDAPGPGAPRAASSVGGRAALSVVVTPVAGEVDDAAARLGEGSVIITPEAGPSLTELAAPPAAGRATERTASNARADVAIFAVGARRALRVWWRDGSLAAVLSRIEERAVTALHDAILAARPSHHPVAEVLVDVARAASANVRVVDTPSMLRARLTLAAAVIATDEGVSATALRAVVDRFVPAPTSASGPSAGALTDAIPTVGVITPTGAVPAVGVITPTDAVPSSGAMTPAAAGSIARVLAPAIGLADRARAPTDAGPTVGAIAPADAGRDAGAMAPTDAGPPTAADSVARVLAPAADPYPAVHASPQEPRPDPTSAPRRTPHHAPPLAFGGELEIRSALPFLLLPSLHHAGWLDTAITLLDLHDQRAAAFALAAGIAGKLLGPPERGWMRSRDDRAVIAAFAGCAESFSDDAVASAASSLGPVLATLDDTLRATLARARAPEAPRVLWRSPRSWYLLDGDGLAVLAAAATLPAVLAAAAGARVLVPAACADPDTLERIDLSNLRFITDAPPTRGEPWRAITGRVGRLWTNDTATLPPRLAAIAAGLDELVARTIELVEILDEQPAVPRDLAPALDATSALAATAALGDLSSRLFPTEPATPVLALSRFHDLDARVSFTPACVRIRVPLGRRHADLMRHGFLTTIPRVPWLGDRAVDLGGA